MLPRNLFGFWLTNKLIKHDGNVENTTKKTTSYAGTWYNITRAIKTIRSYRYQVKVYWYEWHF